MPLEDALFLELVDDREDLLVPLEVLFQLDEGLPALEVEREGLELLSVVFDLLLPVLDIF